jgi:very-short-patch-repair endonuclease
MRQELDMAEQRVALDAARQHGVVTVGQLYGAGIGKSGVARRLRAGRLHRVHRGVYAVGHAGLGQHGHWMAAVLACGEDAALSHRSAAALWDLLKPFRGPIHVTAPSYNGRSRRPGIVLHRCASLAALPTHVTRRQGIPVTTPARTVEDLRGTVAPYLLRRATRQAEIAGYRLGVRAKADRTRSDFERDFLRFCARHELPRPEVNVKVGRWTVDFLWPLQRLAVETDSYRYHRGAIAFEDDHARDLDLRRRGYAVRRFTEAQVRDQPQLVLADLAEALLAAEHC